MRYRITVQYLTPSGRESSYTETVYGFPHGEAVAMVKDNLRDDPRRKVGRIIGSTCEMV